MLGAEEPSPNDQRSSKLPLEAGLVAGALPAATLVEFVRDAAAGVKAGVRAGVEKLGTALGTIAGGE